MKKEKHPIKFKLVKIKTDEFAIIQAKENEEKEFQVDVSFGFKLNPGNRIISIIGEINFERSENPFIKLTISCNFQIEEESWKKGFEVENGYRISKGFATHLAIIVVGTARGVLHAKLEDTLFNHYFLPTIDLSGTFKEDIFITNQSK